MTGQPKISPGQAAYDKYYQFKVPALVYSTLSSETQDKWERVALAACEAGLPQHRQPPAAPESGRHASEAETAAYMQEVADFWWPIVKPNGVIDEPQLLLELADLSHLLREVPLIYNELAGLSKPFYWARTIISEARRRIDLEIEESLLETMPEDRDSRRRRPRLHRGAGRGERHARPVLAGPGVLRLQLAQPGRPRQGLRL